MEEVFLGIIEMKGEITPSHTLLYPSKIKNNFEDSRNNNSPLMTSHLHQSFKAYYVLHKENL